MAVRLQEHNTPKYECSACGKDTDLEGRLCQKCERRLATLARTVDPTLEWLEQMAAVETAGLATPKSDGKSRNHETVNIAPATLAADQLVRAVAAWIVRVKSEMVYSPKWRGTAGQQLTALVPYIAGQHYAGLLIDELHGEFQAIKKDWPQPTDRARATKPLPVPCFDCGNKTLWVHPVAHYRQPLRLACEYKNPETGRYCGWSSKEDGQDLMAKLTLLKKEADRLDRLAEMALRKSGWLGWRFPEPDNA